MSEEREWGVGSRESENKPSSPAEISHAPLPTPHTPNWKLLYAAVLTELALLILIFYAFTKAFA
jgi:hypothetical protein